MKPGTTLPNAPGEPLLPLVKEIRELVQRARRTASQNVNTLQVSTNFEIGRRIVEFEQQGSRRAEYGGRILKELSHRLTEELGRGFSKSNLEYMRRFYLEYHDTVPQIAQTVSGQLPAKTPTEMPIMQTLSAKLTPHFTLSWSHYIFLMNINNQEERRFYEIESGQNQWSLSELKRQFNSGIYERLALSRDKNGVKALADKGQVIGNPQDVLTVFHISPDPRQTPSQIDQFGLDQLSHGPPITYAIPHLQKQPYRSPPYD